MNYIIKNWNAVSKPSISSSSSSFRFQLLLNQINVAKESLNDLIKQFISRVVFDWQLLLL